jgi:putative ABC transport system substrate-binding protein
MTLKTRLLKASTRE